MSGYPTTRRFPRTYAETDPHLHSQWWEHEPNVRFGRLRWAIGVVIAVLVVAALFFINLPGTPR